METQIVGLYSFPKSGNTWLRAMIIAGLGMKPDANTMHRYCTDTQFDKSIRSLVEVNGKTWGFYKSHFSVMIDDLDAYEIKTDKVVYIYRHPLDVFMSYLNFVSKNVAPAAAKAVGIEFDSVEDLTADQFEMLFQRYTEHGTIIPQNMMFGSVFGHIRKFTELRDNGFPVHIMRYEDLMDDFDETSRKMFEFIGIDNVDTTEVYGGADNATAKNGKFFWKRQKDNYKNYLTPEQVDRFFEVHGDEMERLGYGR